MSIIHWLRTLFCKNAVAPDAAHLPIHSDGLWPPWYVRDRHRHPHPQTPHMLVEARIGNWYPPRSALENNATYQHNVALGCVSNINRDSASAQELQNYTAGSHGGPIHWYEVGWNAAIDRDKWTDNLEKEKVE